MLDSLRSLSIVWWLPASLLAYVLVANLSWRLQGWTEGRGQPLGAIMRRIAASPATAIGSFAYTIAIPYAALLLGVLDARLTGLIGFDWLVSLQVAAAVGLATGALLLLDRIFVRRFSQPPVSEGATPTPLAMLWRVAFQQAHLGFYRGALAALLGSYSGAFAALGLVLVEWALNPAWRAGWSHEPQQQALAFDLALALATTIIFLYTGNLWVCAAVHAILTLALHVRYQEVRNARNSQGSI